MGNEKKGNCPFVDHVDCLKMTCDRCGWNPEVSAARLQQFLKTGRVVVEKPNTGGPDWDDQRESGLLTET